MTDPPEALTRPEIMAWRKAERARLLAKRREMPAAARRAAGEAIAATLHRHLEPHQGETVSLYWPINYEPNLIPLIDALPDIRFALPVVLARAQPLEFRSWRKGEALTKGIWDIPVPAAGPVVEPDILVAPVVGHDPSCYRLGYGGGFFDRTLAALPPKLVLGVGYAFSRIPTIHPLPHDIALAAVITEEDAIRP